MHRVIIFMLVALFVFFCNVNILSAAEGNSAAQTKSTATVKVEKPKVTTPKTGLKSDANIPAEPNRIDPNAEPNAMTAKWRKDLDESIERLELNNQDESREWTQRLSENRVSRLRAIDKQVTEEFDLIRSVALEENAARTVESIDRVLVVRKERLEKLIDSIEEARKEERKKDLQEKREQRRKEIEERRSRTEQQRK